MLRGVVFVSKLCVHGSAPLFVGCCSFFVGCVERKLDVHKVDASFYSAQSCAKCRCVKERRRQQGDAETAGVPSPRGVAAQVPCKGLHCIRLTLLPEGVAEVPMPVTTLVCFPR